jgi:hypothetical protein
MSGTRDTNWRSYVGPADNGRTITSADWQPPAQPKQWDDGVKGSRLKNFTVHGLEIPDFAEDSIDFVQGEAYTIRDCICHGSITAKGAIAGLLIQCTAVAGTIELGQYDNYWLPGRAPTRDVVLDNVNSPRGQRPRVKLWDATVPKIYASEIELIIVPRAIVRAFFLFRHLTNRARARA